MLIEKLVLVEEENFVYLRNGLGLWWFVALKLIKYCYILKENIFIQICVCL